MTQIMAGSGYQAAFFRASARARFPDLDPALNLWPAVKTEPPASRLFFVEEVVAVIEERVLASVAARAPALPARVR